MNNRSATRSVLWHICNSGGDGTISKYLDEHSPETIVARDFRYKRSRAYAPHASASCFDPMPHFENYWGPRHYELRLRAAALDQRRVKCKASAAKFPHEPRRPVAAFSKSNPNDARHIAWVFSRVVELVVNKNANVFSSKPSHKIPELKHSILSWPPLVAIFGIVDGPSKVIGGQKYDRVGHIGVGFDLFNDCLILAGFIGQNIRLQADAASVGLNSAKHAHIVPVHDKHPCATHVHRYISL